MLLLLEEVLAFIEEQQKSLEELNSVTLASDKLYKKLCSKIALAIIKLIKYQQELEPSTEGLKLTYFPCKYTVKSEIPGIKPACVSDIKQLFPIDVVDPSTSVFDECGDPGNVYHVGVRKDNINDQSENSNQASETEKENEIVMDRKNPGDDLNLIPEPLITRKIKNIFGIDLNKKYDSEGETDVQVDGQDSDPDYVAPILDHENIVEEVLSPKHIFPKKTKKQATCHICKKTLGDSYKLTRHMAKHTGIKKYKCSKCDKAYLYEESLTEHMIKHSNNTRPYNCTMCLASYPSNRQLRVHILRHKGPGSFKCKKCDKCFYSEPKLNRHQECHLKEKPYKCTMCTKAFKRSDILKGHMLVHYGKEPFKCSVCDKKFVLKSTMKKHEEMHSDHRPYKCDSCNKSFKQQISLTQHNMAHAGIYPHCCKLCPKKFIRKSHLVLHQSKHEVGKKHECSICGRKFKQQQYFTWHMQHHRNERKPFQCSYCDKQYLYLSDFRRHEIRHTHPELVPEHKCHLCSYKTSSKSHLNRHIATHTTAKSFPCPKCDKKFLTQSYVTQHLYTHNDKKWLCKICGKKYAKKPYLEHHMFVHTGKSKYECPVCHKKLSHKGQYDRHVEIHNKSKYKCRICLKKFPQVRYLQTHLARHNTQNIVERIVKETEKYDGVDPNYAEYKCKFCSDKFTSVSRLRVHIERHSEKYITVREVRRYIKGKNSTIIDRIATDTTTKTRRSHRIAKQPKPKITDSDYELGEEELIDEIHDLHSNGNNILISKRDAMKATEALQDFTSSFSSVSTKGSEILKLNENRMQCIVKLEDLGNLAPRANKLGNEIFAKYQTVSAKILKPANNLENTICAPVISLQDALKATEAICLSRQNGNRVRVNNLESFTKSLHSKSNEDTNHGPSNSIKTCYVELFDLKRDNVIYEANETMEEVNQATEVITSLIKVESDELNDRDFISTDDLNSENTEERACVVQLVDLGIDSHSNNINTDGIKLDSMSTEDDVWVDTTKYATAPKGVDGESLIDNASETDNDSIGAESGDNGYISMETDSDIEIGTNNLDPEIDNNAHEMFNNETTFNNVPKSYQISQIDALYAVQALRSSKDLTNNRTKVTNSNRPFVIKSTNMIAETIHMDNNFVETYTLPVVTKELSIGLKRLELSHFNKLMKNNNINSNDMIQAESCNQNTVYVDRSNHLPNSLFLLSKQAVDSRMPNEISSPVSSSSQIKSFNEAYVQSCMKPPLKSTVEFTQPANSDNITNLLITPLGQNSPNSIPTTEVTDNMSATTIVEIYS